VSIVVESIVVDSTRSYARIKKGTQTSRCEEEAMLENNTNVEWYSRNVVEGYEM